MAARHLLAASVLCACPQLLSDDFEIRPGIVTTGAGGSEPFPTGSLDAGVTAGGGTSAGAGGTADAGPRQSCNDQVQNQDEQGVDCGGSCPPCACVFGPFSPPELLGIDIAGDEHGPALSGDGLTLYFSAQGPGSEDIFVATRASTTASFGMPRLLETVSSAALDGSPALSGEGKALYFFSDRAGGPGNRDLWVAPFNPDTASFDPATLVANVNSPDLELSPALSRADQSLFFISARDGGGGQSDIWEARRGSATEAFEDPIPRVDLNSSGRDEGVTVTRDGLQVIFTSNRGDGSDMDLWTASRPSADAEFNEPTLLGAVNSGGDDLDPELSPDHRELIFVSSRDSGGRRLWRATRECE